jgi:hypothetical protein
MENIRKILAIEVSIGSYKILAVHLAAAIFLIWIIFGHALCSCCRTNIFEGFTAGLDEPDVLEDEKDKDKEEKKEEEQFKNLDEGFANNLNATIGPSYLSNSESTFVIDPSKWSYSGGATPSASKPNYQSQDPSQMNIIENMKFAPECCPSSYSSSQGCACMSDDAINFLASRGGNN